MKKLLLALTILFLATNLMAQNSNLIIFSDSGEEFTMYLNGVKQNDSPVANVKATDLNADFYKVRLEFNNKSIPAMDKSVWFETKGLEYTFSITQKKNGKYVLRPVSQTEITEPDESAHISESEYESPEQEETPGHRNNDIQFRGSIQETQQSVVDRKPMGEKEAPEKVEINMSVNGNSMNTDIKDENGENVSVSMSFDTGEETSSKTTTTTSVSDSPENITFDIQTDENNENVSVNMSLNGTQSGTYTTTTTTTTTSSSYSSSSSGTNDYYEELTVEDNTETGNCTSPMNSMDFDDALKSISEKTFEDSRLTLAKQICKSNCMTSEQIKNVMKVMDFEESRLDFAKYAYDYVYDINNYYKVNDAFEFEMSIDELNEFIESH